MVAELGSYRTDPVTSKLEILTMLTFGASQVVVKNQPANAGDIIEVGSILGSRRSHGRGPGESHGQRSLVGYNLWGH